MKNELKNRKHPFAISVTSSPVNHLKINHMFINVILYIWIEFGYNCMNIFWLITGFKNCNFLEVFFPYNGIRIFNLNSIKLRKNLSKLLYWSSKQLYSIFIAHVWSIAILFFPGFYALLCTTTYSKNQSYILKIQKDIYDQIAIFKRLYKRSLIMMDYSQIEICIRKCL